jgi:hypothetical protein
MVQREDSYDTSRSKCITQADGSHQNKLSKYVHAREFPIPSAWSMSAIGRPTFFDRPHTTAFLPKVVIPVSVYNEKTTNNRITYSLSHHSSTAKLLQP